MIRGGGVAGVPTIGAAGSTHETWDDVIATVRANLDLFSREGRFPTLVAV